MFHNSGGSHTNHAHNAAFTAFLDASNVNMLWEVLSDELGISRAADAAGGTTSSAADTILKRNVQQVFQRNLQLFAQQPPPAPALGGANNNSLSATSQYNRQFLAQVTQALRQLNVIGGTTPPTRRLTIGEELLPVSAVSMPQQSERNAAQFTADLEQKQREFEAFANPMRPAEIDFTQSSQPAPQQPMAPIDALVAGKLAERNLENAAFQQYNSPPAAASAFASGSSVSNIPSPLLPPELVPQETAIKARLTPQQQQHVKWQDEQPQTQTQTYAPTPANTSFPLRGSIFDKLKPVHTTATTAATATSANASEEKAKRERELAEMQTLYEQPPKTTPKQMVKQLQPTPPPLVPESTPAPKPPPPPPLLPFEEWAKQMNAMRDEMDQLKRRVAELENNLAAAVTTSSNNGVDVAAEPSGCDDELDE